SIMDRIFHDIHVLTYSIITERSILNLLDKDVEGK
ncbi:hypothetical protein LCGC14_1650990, partial [marine sediment metagenome]